MKSIWDVRFTKKKLAMDAAVKNAFVALDEWITVHPNGPDELGRKVELGENGEILHGMGGKFNGLKLEDIKIQSAFTKEYHGEQNHPDDPSDPKFLARLDRYNKDKPEKFLARPGFVKPNMEYDKKGNPVANVEVPKTLEGAGEYFNKMCEETEKLFQDAHRNGRDDEAKALSKNIDKLRKLRNGFETWRDFQKDGGPSGNGEYTQKWHQNLRAGNSIEDLFKYCNADPRGVGRWAAEDAYEKMERYLSQERKDYFLAQRRKWK